MKTILARDRTGATRAVLVDDADFAALAQRHWRIEPGDHVRTDVQTPTRRFRPGRGWDRRSRSVSMARLLLDLEVGDRRRPWFRNGNPLDCRRDNLRVVAFAGQQRRRPNRPRAGSSVPQSKYRGVCWDARSRKWRATFRGVRLGVFATERAAHKAAQAARRRLMPFANDTVDRSAHA